MQEYRVVIPKESSTAAAFEQEGRRGVAVINQALVDFEPKVVFRWHLSIMLQLEGELEDGMPSKDEHELIDTFGDRLHAALTTPKAERENGLFLARITWNASREMIYRIFDPELANDFLQGLIANKDYPRDFDFRMDDDPDWKLAAWHLKTAAE